MVSCLIYRFSLHKVNSKISVGGLLMIHWKYRLGLVDFKHLNFTVQELHWPTLPALFTYFISICFLGSKSFPVPATLLAPPGPRAALSPLCRFPGWNTSLVGEYTLHHLPLSRFPLFLGPGPGQLHSGKEPKPKWGCTDFAEQVHEWITSLIFSFQQWNLKERLSFLRLKSFWWIIRLLSTLWNST